MLFLYCTTIDHYYYYKKVHLIPQNLSYQRKNKCHIDTKIFFVSINLILVTLIYFTHLVRCFVL